MKFSKENVVNVWSDEDGTHIYVGPDADGLGCVELRYVDENGKIFDRITMPPEQAKLVAESIFELLTLTRKS